MQVNVSPKYQVVIPKEIRDSLDIRPGQKMDVINYDGVIRLVPVKGLPQARGILKGVPNNFTRDTDRI